MDEFVGKMDAIVVAEVTSVIGSDERNSCNEQDNIRNIKEGDLVCIVSTFGTADGELRSDN